MDKLLLSLILLSLLLIAGFALLVTEQGRSLYEVIGGFLMVAAVVSAAATDIRLRSPQVRKQV